MIVPIPFERVNQENDIKNQEKGHKVDETNRNDLNQIKREDRETLTSKNSSVFDGRKSKVPADKKIEGILNKKNVNESKANNIQADPEKSNFPVTVPSTRMVGYQESSDIEQAQEKENGENLSPLGLRTLVRRRTTKRGHTLNEALQIGEKYKPKSYESYPILCAFVIYEVPRDRKICILDFIKENHFYEKLCSICCKKRRKRIRFILEGCRLKLSTPDDPEHILYDNLSHTFWNRQLMKLIFWIMNAILWFLIFMIVVFLYHSEIIGFINRCKTGL